MEKKYYVCEICGKIVEVVKDTAVPTVCCGQKMSQIIPGTVEASKEKHIPVYSIDDNKIFVTVGEVEHPMAAEHYIEWISVETKYGSQVKKLNPGELPAACFSVCGDDEVVAVYAYCNLHGLWKADVVEAPVCDLAPVDTNTNENYTVCKCNKVSYFDILDEIHKHSDISKLLGVFEEVKNTTHCSTGCGGCYERVLTIISDTMNK